MTPSKKMRDKIEGFSQKEPTYYLDLFKSHLTTETIIILQTFKNMFFSLLVFPKVFTTLFSSKSHGIVWSVNIHYAYNCQVSKVTDLWADGWEATLNALPPVI